MAAPPFTEAPPAHVSIPEMRRVDDATPHQTPIDPAVLRVAIVHYWFIERRGGEKVVDALCQLFPRADIFTHYIDRPAFPELTTAHTITTSFIQRLPFARLAMQLYLPLMPLALEQFDFSNYDLVISCESGPSKGIITREDCITICYCFSPMRYIWNKYAEYIKWTPRILSWPMRLISHYLRIVDYASAARVDHFIADSTVVARRIKKYYRRTSDIVFPPVDVAAFESAEDEGYYLYCGQLTAYKRPDLAVDCFNQLGLPLRVIGDGEMRRRLQKRAKPNVTFLGRLPDAALRHQLARCRALVFPGEEDFGIVPVEAMASGRPVIAYARGGALDTVVDGVTGLLFKEASIEGLAGAVRRFEGMRGRFDPQAIRRHADRFDVRHFKERMTSLIAQMVSAQDPPIHGEDAIGAGANSAYRKHQQMTAGNQ